MGTFCFLTCFSNQVIRGEEFEYFGCSMAYFLIKGVTIDALVFLLIVDVVVIFQGFDFVDVTLCIVDDLGGAICDEKLEQLQCFVVVSPVWAGWFV